MNKRTAPFTPKRRRRLTPRQRVLKKYPGAYAAVCWRFISIIGYVVCDNMGRKIGRMKDSPSLAWANAAERL